jgi:hypothetical protein
VVRALRSSTDEAVPWRMKLKEASSVSSGVSDQVRAGELSSKDDASAGASSAEG